MAKRERMDFIEHYRLVAHRGLHDSAKGVPENSLAAFQLAIERGHAIELDLRITADRQVVVFHDSTLERMTGVPGQVDRWVLADLKKLRLLGTEQCIPTLDEMLELVNGQVPLLIEIKRDRGQELGRLEPILMKSWNSIRATSSSRPLTPRCSSGCAATHPSTSGDSWAASARTSPKCPIITSICCSIR